SWGANHVLHWSGECPRSVLCVHEGRVRMRRFDSAGHEQILSWFEAGGLLACAPVIADKPFHFDIVTDEPCKVLHVDRTRFMERLRRDAAVAAAVATMLSERLVFVAESHVTRINEPLAERVWLRLTRMAQQADVHGASRDAGIPVTQQELADAVGASRYRVGLELQRLADRGLIVMTRRNIRVLPPVTAGRPRIGPRR
ncbi:MAG: Crp/Fnr family transcriptional regulator, partial [Proteobacteria bacterium]|nr:Crp/Fnr family transcriptional regulator [Pseudomonadota bacterium]